MIWRWVLIWTVLLLASAVYLGLRGRGLWGQFKALGRELADAQARLDEVHHQLERLDDHSGPSEPVQLAMFLDPLQLHLERQLMRQQHRAERLRRRRARRPGWARRALKEDQLPPQ